MKTGLIVVLSVLLSGCGLFTDDGDPFDIDIRESVEFDFSIDSNDLCPTGQDCSVDPEPSPGVVDIPAIEIPFPINIAEATGNSQLTDAAQRIKSVEIESVDYTISPNTMNIPSREFQLWLGPKGATSRDASGTVQLVTIPSAPAGMEVSDSVSPAASSVGPASDLFKTLDFNAIGYSDDDIEEGELFPPQGAATYKIKVNLKFVVNPIDQL